MRTIYLYLFVFLNISVQFLLGDGLGTSFGAKWQAHRHLINPGFHADAQKGMVKYVMFLFILLLFSLLLVLFILFIYFFIFIF